MDNVTYILDMDLHLISNRFSTMSMALGIQSGTESDNMSPNEFKRWGVCVCVCVCVCVSIVGITFDAIFCLVTFVTFLV